jgi:hypothetical protein
MDELRLVLRAHWRRTVAADNTRRHLMLVCRLAVRPCAGRQDIGEYDMHNARPRIDDGMRVTTGAS